MKRPVRKILTTFVLSQFLLMQVITTFANPLNFTLQPTNITSGAVTTHTMTYSPPVNMQNNWQLVLDYDGSTDLNAVTAGDVAVTGTNVTGSVATIDTLDNDITITLSVTGTTSNPLNITLDNVGNIGYLGSARVAIIEKNDLGAVQNRDYTYYNTANSGASLAITNFTSSSFHFDELSTLSFTVQPTTNLQNNEWIRVELPSGYLNFGSTTLPDVVIDSASNNCGVAAIDNQSSYLDIQLCETTDTAGNPITFHIDNVRLPEVQLSNQLTLTTFNELRDTSYDQGFVNYTMAEHPLIATITPNPVSAGSSGVTYTVSITPQGSAVEQYDQVQVNFPGGTGLQNGTLVDTSPDYAYTDINISGSTASFKIDSASGTGLEPITFTVVGSVSNNLGTATANITIYGDQGDNNSTDGTAFEGTASYTIMMRVEPYPDSVIQGDTTVHRVLFRPNPSAEQDWHVRLTYTDVATADLSGVTSGDITLTGANSPTPSNVVIDDFAKTIDFDLNYSTSDSSGSPIVAHIANVVNPAGPGTYTVRAQVYDQLMVQSNEGTGTFVIGSLFPINIVVDVPYENTQTPFHLNMQPPVNVSNNWDMLLQFPPEVDLSDVQSSDLDINNFDNFSSFNNFVVNNTDKTIRVSLSFSSGGSFGDDLDVDILDVITPATAGTYTIQAFFLKQPDGSGPADLVAAQGTGDFVINPGGPPYIVSAYPANNSVDQPRSPQQVYVINDLDSPVNVATLNIISDGVPVYINGVCQTTDFTCNAIVPSGNQITVSFHKNVPYGQNVYVDVNIQVEDGNAILLNRTLTFDTVNGPDLPQNLYTNDATIGAQSGLASIADFNHTNPVFSAQYFDSDGAPSTHYQLQVSDDPGFATTLYDSGKTSIVINPGDRSPDLTSTPSSAYLTDTDYYWRIRWWEENQNGILPTDWSNAQFIMRDLPYLVSVTPGDTSVIGDPDPTLSWTFKDDGDGMDVNQVSVTMYWYDSLFNFYTEPLIAYNIGTGLYECDPTYTTSCTVIDNGDGSITVNADPSSTFDTAGSIVFFDIYVQDLVANQVNFSTSFNVATDSTAPAVTAQTPADTATDVGPNPTFSYTIDDSGGSDVDVSTVNITVNGTPAVTNGVCQTGFTCTSAPTVDAPSTVWTFTRDTPFSTNEAVAVHIEASDTASTPNPMTYDTNFTVQTDVTAPTVTAQTPANAATGQAFSPNFSYTITDTDSQVSAASVTIMVEGVNAILNGVCQAGFTCSLTPGADAANLTFAFTSDTPYAASQVIDVVVNANDTAPTPNPMNYNTSFTVRANVAPGAPTGLEANGFTNPVGLTNPNVDFSAIHHDADGDPADQYQIQVASDGGFGTIVYDSGAGGTAMPTTADGARSQLIDPPGTFPAGSYFWRIKFWDDLNTEGTFSATATFSIAAADTTPPSIISQTPGVGAANVGLTPTFNYSIADIDSNVDISTVDITVGGEAAILNGVCGTGYTCTTIPGSDAPTVTYEFTRNAAFTNSQAVTVNVVANDTAAAPNTLNVTSGFTTEAAASGATPASSGGSGGGFTPGNVPGQDPNAGQIVNNNTNTSQSQGQTNTNAPDRPSAPTQPPINAPIADTCKYFEELAHSNTVNYGDLSDQMLSDYAKYLLDNGIILGKNPTEFGPKDMMTRAEVLRSLVQARCDKFTLMPVTAKPFPDVSTSHPDAIYIDAAKRANIVNGYKEDGTYRPDKFISRAEALKVVVQEVLGSEIRSFDGPINPFTDVGNSEWYVNYVRFGVAAGLIDVPGDKMFYPNEPMSREEITRLLAKTLQSRETILQHLDVLIQEGATAEEIAQALGEENRANQNSNTVENPRDIPKVDKSDVVKEPIPACSYFEARETTHDYSDISNSALGDFAKQLLEYGVVIGKEQNEFVPRDEVSRSEILRVIIQANCKDFILMPVTVRPFPDVPVDHRDAVFIQAAKNAKIINGYGDGTYKPDNKTTHAEILKILLETALNKIVAGFDSTQAQPFADVDGGAWYARYVRYAAFHDLAVSVDGARFEPNVNGNRGYIAAMLLKILQFRDGLMGQR